MARTVYYGSLTVPAGTPLASPASQGIRTAPGTLTLFRLFVPPGPRGEVSLWLAHQSTQVAPVPPETWDQLDDVNLEFILDLPLPINETDLTLYGASPYASFEHTIGFEALVDTTPQSAQPQSNQSILGKLSSILGG